MGIVLTVLEPPHHPNSDLIASLPSGVGHVIDVCSRVVSPRFDALLVTTRGLVVRDPGSREFFGVPWSNFSIDDHLRQHARHAVLTLWLDNNRPVEIAIDRRLALNVSCVAPVLKTNPDVIVDDVVVAKPAIARQASVPQQMPVAPPRQFARPEPVPVQSLFPLEQTTLIERTALLEQTTVAEQTTLLEQTAVADSVEPSSAGFYATTSQILADDQTFEPLVDDQIFFDDPILADPQTTVIDLTDLVELVESQQSERESADAAPYVNPPKRPTAPIPVVTEFPEVEYNTVVVDPVSVPAEPEHRTTPIAPVLVRRTTVSSDERAHRAAWISAAVALLLVAGIVGSLAARYLDGGAAGTARLLTSQSVEVD